MGNKKSLTLKEVYLNEGGNFKTLYHIGKHPARPQPLGPAKWGGGGEDGWHRPWIKKPVTEPVVFMTDNWQAVRRNHGVWGNVYSYKVPMAAIKAAGGLHTFDRAKEVLFTHFLMIRRPPRSTRSTKVIDMEKAEKRMRDTGYDTFSSWKMSYGGGDDAAKVKPAGWEKLADLDPAKAREAVKLIGAREVEGIFKRLQKWIKTAKPAKAQNYDDPTYARRRQKMNNDDFKEKLDKALALEKLLKSL
jgi:hypothetical protein